MKRILALAAVAAALCGPAAAQVGPLDARNNLSDVASVSASLSNLGLGPSASVTFGAGSFSSLTDSGNLSVTGSVTGGAAAFSSVTDSGTLSVTGTLTAGTISAATTNGYVNIGNGNGTLLAVGGGNSGAPLVQLSGGAQFTLPASVTWPGTASDHPPIWENATFTGSTTAPQAGFTLGAIVTDQGSCVSSNTCAGINEKVILNSTNSVGAVSAGQFNLNVTGLTGNLTGNAYNAMQIGCTLTATDGGYINSAGYPNYASCFGGTNTAYIGGSGQYFHAAVGLELDIRADQGAVVTDIINESLVNECQISGSSCTAGQQAGRDDIALALGAQAGPTSTFGRKIGIGFGGMGFAFPIATGGTLIGVSNGGHPSTASLSGSPFSITFNHTTGTATAYVNYTGPWVFNPGALANTWGVTGCSWMGSSSANGVGWFITSASYSSPTWTLGLINYNESQAAGGQTTDCNGTGGTLQYFTPNSGAVALYGIDFTNLSPTGAYYTDGNTSIGPSGVNTTTGFWLGSAAMAAAANGSTQGAGTAITTQKVSFATVTSTNYAATLPNCTAALQDGFVTNNGANPLSLFPYSGETINALAANSSVLVGVGTTVHWQCTSTSGTTVQ